MSGNETECDLYRIESATFGQRTILIAVKAIPMSLSDLYSLESTAIMTFYYWSVFMIFFCVSNNIKTLVLKYPSFSF